MKIKVLNNLLKKYVYLRALVRVEFPVRLGDYRPQRSVLVCLFLHTYECDM